MAKANGKKKVPRSASHSAGSDSDLLYNERLQESLMMLMVAEPGPGAYKYFDDLPIETIEDTVDALVDIATDGGCFMDHGGHPFETRQRAAMMACRILAHNHLHLPENCERCSEPLRGPVEIEHTVIAREYCTCRPERAKAR